MASSPGSVGIAPARSHEIDDQLRRRTERGQLDGAWRVLTPWTFPVVLGTGHRPFTADDTPRRRSPGVSATLQLEQEALVEPHVHEAGPLPKAVRETSLAADSLDLGTRAFYT